MVLLFNFFVDCLCLQSLKLHPYLHFLENTQEVVKWYQNDCMISGINISLLLLSPSLLHHWKFHYFRYSLFLSLQSFPSYNIRSKMMHWIVNYTPNLNYLYDLWCIISLAFFQSQFSAGFMGVFYIEKLLIIDISNSFFNRLFLVSFFFILVAFMSYS